MNIPGLSTSRGPATPTSVFTGNPVAEAQFGMVYETYPELDALWDSGEIATLYSRTFAKDGGERESILSERSDSASGASLARPDMIGPDAPDDPRYDPTYAKAQWPMSYKSPQPTIFGPTVIYSNVLELRRRLLG